MANCLNSFLLKARLHWGYCLFWPEVDINLKRLLAQEEWRFQLRVVAVFGPRVCVVHGCYETADSSSVSDRASASNRARTPIGSTHCEAIWPNDKPYALGIGRGAK